MKLTSFLFIALLILLSGAAETVAQGTERAAEPDVSRLAKMLPAKPITAQTMDVKLPEETVRITKKILRAQGCAKSGFSSTSRTMRRNRPPVPDLEST